MRRELEQSRIKNCKLEQRINTQTEESNRTISILKLKLEQLKNENLQLNEELNEKHEQLVTSQLNVNQTKVESTRDSDMLKDENIALI